MWRRGWDEARVVLLRAVREVEEAARMRWMMVRGRRFGPGGWILRGRRARVQRASVARDG